MLRRLRLPMLVLVAVFAMVAVGAQHTRADERDFTLVNGSGVTITHIFVSPSDASDWGDDILGQDVLDPGNSVFIYFTRFAPDMCLYDVSVMGQNGEQG